MWRFLILITLFLALGCKETPEEERDSDLSFDPAASAIVAFTQLSKEERLTLCRRSVMMMFVGNAEDNYHDARVVPKPEPVSSGLNLLNIIKNEADSLQNALKFNQCSTIARSDPETRKARMMLVRVIDGPGQDDSQIDLTWYSWNSSGTKWEPKSQKLVAKDIPGFGKDAADCSKTLDKTYCASLHKNGGAKFELHLPSQINSLAAHFFKMEEGGFDQTMYLFKSHGGRFLDKGTDDKLVKPSLAYAVLGESTETKIAKKAKHVFLFDPHGPGARSRYDHTVPGMYIGHWDPAQACALIAQDKKLASELLKSGNPNCLTCQRILGPYSAELGGTCSLTSARQSVFAAYQRVLGSKAGGEFLGSKAGGEFLGSKAGGEFLGSKAGGEFLGSKAGGEFLGSKAGGEFLGSKAGGEFFGSKAGGEFLGSKAGGEFLGSKAGGEFLGSKAGGEFLGSKAGGEFLGSKNGGEFLGSKAGGEFLGSKAGGEFLSSKKAGEFLGSKSGGEFLGSKAGGEFLGSKAGGEFLGGGKGFIFSTAGFLTDPADQKSVTYDPSTIEKIETLAIPKTPTVVSPSEIAQVAQGVSYDMEPEAVQGVHNLQLPSGTQSGAPTMIVLDSCYGDKAIRNAIVNMTKDKSKTRCVVVSNDSPMKANIMNYGSFNATKYLAFSQVHEWHREYSAANTLNQHSAIKTIKEGLDEHLGQHGLINMIELQAALDKAKKENRAISAKERMGTYIDLTLKELLQRQAKAEERELTREELLSTLKSPSFATVNIETCD